MTHGSLFSGIGGFDLAAQWMGWENIFHCEWNPFGQRVLKHYWPDAISYHDITKTDFTIHRGNIDILTGGFPCQPYSQAGKRLGKEDDRHLWPQMLRAIREIQPRWVVGENVRGLTNWNGGMVFDEVQADLETQGYEVTPFLLPACAVNAPHRRDRIWFVAYSDLLRFNNGKRKHEINSSEGRKYALNDIEQICNATDTGLLRQEISEKQTAGIEQLRKEQSFTNPQRDGYNGNEIIEEGQQHDERGKAWSESTSFSESSDVTDTSSGIRIQDNERHTSSKSKYACPGWERFPTQSPVCIGDDGFSSRLDGITFPKWRNESIKAGGNAIVPQVAFEIFKAIEQYH